MRVLLVEDTAALASALADGLQRQGFVVDAAATCGEARDLLAVTSYAIIILDRRLPDGDGLDLCSVARAREPATAILVLTARDAVDDRVSGLNAGADDYLVKPFAFAELLARLRAVTRRREPARSDVLRAGPLEFDRATGEVRVTGRLVDVSAKERLILAALLRHPGRVLTHEQLLNDAWNVEAAPSVEGVRAHVKNLRRKLAASGAHGLIETVHGLGYRVAC